MEEKMEYRGVVAVVDADSLQMLTERRGYELIQVLPCTVVMGHHDEVKEFPSNSYYNGTRSDERRVVSIAEYGNGHKFLVRKDADAVRREMADSIDRLIAEETRLQNHVNKLEAEAESLRKARDEAKGLLDSTELKLNAAIQRERDLSARVRRMEVDLGKVRKDIGEREFARITGAVETQNS